MQLLTTFLFIFLAAAPGRTSFVLMMLASHGRLKSIFVGAAAAFLIQCMFSVLLGGLLVLLPQALVQLASALLFIFFAYSFWKQSEKSIDSKLVPREIGAKSVFLVIFMAEFGDVSQLAIATSAAKSSSKISVFILAVIALWIITGVALLVGHKLTQKIMPDLIQKIASLAFLSIGMFQFFQVFF